MVNKAGQTCLGAKCVEKWGFEFFVLGLGDLFSIVCVLSCWFIVYIKGKAETRVRGARTTCTSHCCLRALITLVISGCSESHRIFSYCIFGHKIRFKALSWKPTTSFVDLGQIPCLIAIKWPLGGRLMGNHCQPALLLEQEYKGNSVEKSACIYQGDTSYKSV